MTKKLSMKRAIFAGTAIAAGIAFAGISDDFETEGGSSIWTGGSTQAVEIASAPGGFPISDSNHTKVFCIDGEASCSNTGTANSKAQLNFLAYITEPSDELPAANSSEMNGVQIAFAAGTTENDGYVENSTIALMLYCKAKDGQSGPAWQTTGATLAMKKWHHIQLLFDYNNKVCQVCVDGVPLVTELGRQTATDTTNNKGSWYVLANDPASTTSYVSGLTMYGTAQVDDVVVQEGASNKFVGDSGAKIGSTALSYETLAKFGVDATTITQAKLGSSAKSLTVAQCLQCGIDPAGTGEFKVESASLASDGKLELEFPGSVSALNGVTPQYRIEWIDWAGQSTTTPVVTPATETGKVKATVTVPDNPPAVLKYRLKAVAPGTQSNAQ